MSDGAGLQRLERPATLADQAFTEIRAALLGGRDDAALRLFEGELARQLSMSRTPVREALHRLSLVGLVEPASPGGYRRRITTPRGVREHCELRLLLEPYAAELAARRAADGAPPEDLAEIDAADPLEDASFHRTIAAASAASSLPELIGELCDLAALDADTLGAAAVPADADAEHAAILAAIAAGQSDAARAAMTAHLEAVAEALERAAAGRPVKR